MKTRAIKQDIVTVERYAYMVLSLQAWQRVRYNKRSATFHWNISLPLIGFQYTGYSILP